MAWTAQNPEQGFWSDTSIRRVWQIIGWPVCLLFSNKIKKIRNTLVPSGTEKDVHPLSDPSKITAFMQVSEDAFDKIIRNSPTNSCLLDPWPTFLIKECGDILLPSITKLVNCSLMEGCVPDGFQTAVVTHLVKRLIFKWITWRTIALYLSLISYQNWLAAWLLSNF